jgi:hypothetical protein
MEMIVKESPLAVENNFLNIHTLLYVDPIKIGNCLIRFYAYYTTYT